MKEFICTKCNSKDLFTKVNGNQVGLYCSNCGKWIKWLSKEEIRIYDEQKKRKTNVFNNNNKEIQCAACGCLAEHGVRRKCGNIYARRV